MSWAYADAHFLANPVDKRAAPGDMLLTSQVSAWAGALRACETGGGWLMSGIARNRAALIAYITHRTQLTTGCVTTTSRSVVMCRTGNHSRANPSGCLMWVSNLGPSSSLALQVEITACPSSGVPASVLWRPVSVSSIRIEVQLEIDERGSPITTSADVCSLAQGVPFIADVFFQTAGDIVQPTNGAVDFTRRVPCGHDPDTRWCVHHAGNPCWVSQEVVWWAFDNAHHAKCQACASDVVHANRSLCFAADHCLPLPEVMDSGVGRWVSGSHTASQSTDFTSARTEAANQNHFRNDISVTDIAPLSTIPA